MRVWKVIKVAILAINNTVSGCLDQYISIIGKKYYIDFDIDVFVKIEEIVDGNFRWQYKDFVACL